jgi:integrase
MKLNKLTALQVSCAQPGRYGDGGGLALLVSAAKDGSLNRKWVFRFAWHGKPTECGMGGRGTTLAEARAKAAEARRMVREGINPVEAKQAAKAVSLRHVATATFGKCAAALIAAKQSEWRNAVHREQWRTTLETFCAPIWARAVDAIDTAAVLGVLQPVWQATPETASRLRGRIEAVLDAARARGHIPADRANPARWKGHLDHLLAKRTALSRGHHAAMPYKDVPAFVATLRNAATVQATALEFLILTAARSGEVLGARWSEIDLDARVWTIPGVRMKSGREHRVPLSARAVEILGKLAETRCSGFVFPGRHGHLTRSPVAELVPDRATIHGFRSSFRDWCGEETNFPRDLAEGALAHVSGDATERAYRRGDALEKRRALMELWAAFCAKNSVEDNVVMWRPQVASDA